VGPAAEPGQDRRAGVRLQAATVAAAARLAIDDQHLVADLSGPAVRAQVQPAVDHDPTPDAGASTRQTTVVQPTAAPSRVSARAPARASLTRRDRQPEPRLHLGRHRPAGPPPQVGNSTISPVRRVEQPGTASPDAVGRVVPQSRAAAATSRATTASGPSCAPVGVLALATTRQPPASRSTTAVLMLVPPRSTPR
jgi:hypothetical protein